MLQDKYSEAVELFAVWESYFPALIVAPEHWRLLLDDYPSEVIAQAIKRCVKKKLKLNGTFTLENMLSYVEAACRQKTQEVL
jgi:hypothetical protein